MKPRSTSVSLMRVRLAGLCASAAHRSPAKALPPCENSAISRRNSGFGEAGGFQLALEQAVDVAAQHDHGARQQHLGDRQVAEGLRQAPDIAFDAFELGQWHGGVLYLNYSELKSYANDSKPAGSVPLALVNQWISA